MSYHLLIHNILFLAGGALNIILPLVVLFIRRKRLDSLVVTFALMSLSVAVFQITQVLGANAATAEISRQIFMWNICVIPIDIFMAHWFLALIGKTRQHRIALISIYVSGGILFIIHLIFPHTYLLESVPKMYFPFYYNPGPLQWVTRVWFNLVGVYYFFGLFFAYRKEIDPIKKNRYLYVFIAVLYAFILGSTAILLVYNVQFDPMWSSFFGIYPLILAYAVVRYQLLEVKIIIQRAFVYAVLVGALIAVISFSNSLTRIFVSFTPEFPTWIVPLISSLVGVAVGFLIWRKLRESDLLKYEFITVIAHKFRTPLTQTKWAAEELVAAESDPEKRKNLSYITQSNEKLVNLTGTLIELADADKEIEQLYAFKKVSLCDLIQSSAESMRDSFVKKGINFVVECPATDLYANVDRDKISFVIQTLLENALAYTAGGKVSLAIARSGGKSLISITDNGIGISKNDLQMIFSKFYRSHKARAADTEGFGVGLYLAQSIAKRHGGKIEAYSEGEGKGATFTLWLPLAS
jgi:signal transduction histidine kinase